MTLHQKINSAIGHDILDFCVREFVTLRTFSFRRIDQCHDRQADVFR